MGWEASRFVSMLSRGVSRHCLQPSPAISTSTKPKSIALSSSFMPSITTLSVVATPSTQQRLRRVFTVRAARSKFERKKPYAKTAKRMSLLAEEQRVKDKKEKLAKKRKTVSKAACGLAKKPKDLVDIDEVDTKNDLAAVEYVEDIYTFYKSVESEWRPRDYMPSQPEINEKMRLILVEWMINVHLRFELNPETFYLTINIMDRFLSVNPVPRNELQLVGLSALLMSSKYEEIWPPQVEDLVDIADHAYDHKQILVMEKTILGTLEWYLTVPTHYVFLARFIKASIADQQVRVSCEQQLNFLSVQYLLFMPLS